MTDIDDFFTRGSEYPAGECSGTVRPTRCRTCAFKPTGQTVRPADVPLDTLIERTADFDDFLCHCATGRGYETCAGWHAHHGEGATSR